MFVASGRFQIFWSSIGAAGCFHCRFSLPFSLRRLSWLVGVASSLVPGVQAQTAPAATWAAVTLKEVVVSGSRSAQSIDDLPMTMAVLDAADIEQGQIRDIRDTAKNIPNVSVRRASDWHRAIPVAKATQASISAASRATCADGGTT